MKTSTESLRVQQQCPWEEKTCKHQGEAVWCCHVQALQLRAVLMTSLGLSFNRMSLQRIGSLRV